MSAIVLPSHFNLFINGKWVDAKGGKTFPVVNPTNESVICNVHEASSVCVTLVFVKYK